MVNRYWSVTIGDYSYVPEFNFVLSKLTVNVEGVCGVPGGGHQADTLTDR